MKARPRIQLVFVAALLLTISPRLVADDRVTLEPETVLDDLVDAYRSAPTRDRMTVRVTNEARTQEEVLNVAIDPKRREVLIELAQATVRADAKRIALVLESDEKAYFEASHKKGVILESLRELLPPLPIPQLMLAFGTAPPLELELIEYAPGVVWTRAELDPGPDLRDLELRSSHGEDSDPAAETASRPVAILEGEGDRVSVRIELDPETSRLRRMVVVTDQGAATLDLLVEPLAPEPMALDVGRRKAVESLSELTPRAGFVEVGDVLPKLTLLSTNVGPNAEFTVPGAVLLFREMHPGVASAMAAARSIRDQRPTFRFWSAMVIPPTAGELNFRLQSARSWIEPDDPFYTLSGSSTIDRFVEGATGVLVVFDEREIVREIVDLGDPPVEMDPLARGDPDPARQAEIVASIQRVLDLDDS